MAHPLTHDDPQRLGSYALVARLGSGGMGTVYLGRSSGGRTVALKTMHRQFAAQTEFRTRFRLEIDAARVIGGQYGAQVVDADPLAPTPWLATEYVLGPPLDDAVALCGALPEPAVRALGAALCDALAQLHRSDVVHRDLKPSNVLLTARGPKVIDFGIARAAGDDRLTRTGAAAGTPAYMSPEQAVGGEHPPAGDVFALAGVLVFAATGRPPFGSGQPADLLYRVRYAEPDLTGVPDGLRPALEQCLAKDPARRPGTAELGALLHDGAADGTGDIVDRLPDVVLADIAQRSAAVWELQPSRLPAPEEEFTTLTSSSRRPRVTRRSLLTLGGGVLAAGGAAGAWGLLAPDDDTAGPARKKQSQTTPGGAPRLVWKASVEFEGTGDIVPLPVGDDVALVAEGRLLCVDARTGERRAESELVGDPETVLSDGERLFALDGSDPQHLVPVDLTTGSFRAPLARLDGLDALETRLVIAIGRSLVLEGKTRKGWVRFAVDSRTGKEVWRRRMPTPADTFDDLTVTPMGSSYLRTQGESVSRIDARTGATRWSVRVPKKNTGGLWAGRRHAVSPDHLFLGAEELLALRLSDGRTTWRFGKGRKIGKDYDPSADHYGPPVFKDDVVYTTERDNGLIALDARGGRLLWEEDKATASSLSFAANSTVSGRYFYASPDNDAQWIAAIDLRAHRVAWTFQSPLGDRGGVSPTIMTLPKAKRLIVVRGTGVCALPLDA
ncbi:PQQ-binding-like beta-propeller repeat protein [Streptomyces sp. Rer75]|uniref:protein kinase domain-containing protein n=1 Tax=unclassified Streptomyces TaxID=2593676 RepID=UPI0015CFA1F5|nr:PQQ-binding-like beta-propeller repeat protein [Streptomyces sp. Rer75]QLH24486.1 PQQ-binding-like beta-propeller repeat protein [Streptomyces sp. Rer75]